MFLGCGKLLKFFMLELLKVKLFVLVSFVFVMDILRLVSVRDFNVVGILLFLKNLGLNVFIISCVEFFRLRLIVVGL